MTIYSNIITPRLKYITTFIGSQISVDGVLLTADVELFRNSQGPKINYSSGNITDDELWIQPHSLLFEEGIKPQFPVTIEWKERKSFFRANGDFPFDIFAASFYLLSRYEEYLPHEKDEFGRYAHTNSLAHREGFLHVPLVNLWLKDLKTVLLQKFPGITFPEMKFRFIPTYDIDEGYCYLYKSFGRTLGGYARSLLTGKWKEIGQRKNVLTSKIKDPYDSFDWIKDLHETEQGRMPAYVFFLVAAKKGSLDKNISPFHPKWKARIRSFMSSPSFKPGIHPSWQSGEKPELIEKELEIMEEVLGAKTKDSRQHYIRFNLPVTFRQLIQAGIRQDFSMGYGSINGFRASVATPFYWYDLEREETTVLRLYPFCFMDANSFYEQKFSTSLAAKELAHYYHIVRSVNGTLVTIWHNTFLGTHERFLGWRKIYEDFISSITETF